MSISPGRMSTWTTTSLRYYRESQEKSDEDAFVQNSNILAQSIAQSIAKEIFERLNERETHSFLLHADEKKNGNSKVLFF